MTKAQTDGRKKPKKAAPASASGTRPGSKSMGKAEYLEQLAPLELELDILARWLQHTGRRLMVLLEGRDTAGKGGVISAISHPLNPRMCRVVALPKPNDRERTQWYFQRYVAHLPSAGEMVLFDRSWCNRAGVEAVMGYCTPEQTQAFLKQAPLFEKMLVDDGILLFKCWLTVDQEQQEQRFAERLADPLKRWKLSPVDLEARSRYGAYTEARHRMLEATHTKHAPWTLVDSNDQRRGRLALIRHLIDALPEHNVPAAPIEFTPLAGAPLKERFKSALKPI